MTRDPTVPLVPMEIGFSAAVESVIFRLLVVEEEEACGCGLWRELCVFVLVVLVVLRELLSL